MIATMKIPTPIIAMAVAAGASAGVIVLILLVLRPDKEISAAVIAAAATILGSSLSVAIGRYYEKAKELEQLTRQRKTEVYETFIGFWFRILYASKTGEKAPTEREMMKWMVDFTRTLTMWGSDDVILRWGRLRSSMAGHDPTDPSRALKPMLEFEQLMIAMRRDVGYPETAIDKGDLIRMYADDELYAALVAVAKDKSLESR